MPTTPGGLPDVLRPVFDTARIGQDLWQGTMHSCLEFGQGTWPRFFPVASGDNSSSPAEMVDACFAYARKLLEVQEEWARVMLDSAQQMPGWQKPETTTAQPATRAPKKEARRS